MDTIHKLLKQEPLEKWTEINKLLDEFSSKYSEPVLRALFAEKYNSDFPNVANEKI